MPLDTHLVGPQQGLTLLNLIRSLALYLDETFYQAYADILAHTTLLNCFHSYKAGEFCFKPPISEKANAQIYEASIVMAYDKTHSVMLLKLSEYRSNILLNFFCDQTIKPWFYHFLGIVQLDNKILGVYAESWYDKLFNHFPELKNLSMVELGLNLQETQEQIKRQRAQRPYKGLLVHAEVEPLKKIFKIANLLAERSNTCQHSSSTHNKLAINYEYNNYVQEWAKAHYTGNYISQLLNLAVENLVKPLPALVLAPPKPQLTGVNMPQQSLPTILNQPGDQAIGRVGNVVPGVAPAAPILNQFRVAAELDNNFSDFLSPDISSIPNLQPLSAQRVERTSLSFDAMSLKPPTTQKPSVQPKRTSGLSQFSLLDSYEAVANYPNLTSRR